MTFPNPNVLPVTSTFGQSKLCTTDFLQWLCISPFQSLHTVLLMETLTLNLPWKITSRRKCGACCSDPGVGDRLTSTSASSVIVQSPQIVYGDKLMWLRVVCKPNSPLCALPFSVRLQLLFEMTCYMTVFGVQRPLPLIWFSSYLPRFCSFACLPLKLCEELGICLSVEWLKWACCLVTWEAFCEPRSKLR